jgi:hypothetical protein
MKDDDVIDVKMFLSSVVFTPVTVPLVDLPEQDRSRTGAIDRTIIL